MKVMGVLLMTLAVVLAVVPQYGNCEARGGMSMGAVWAPAAASAAVASTSTAAAAMQTAAAPTPKMRCLWTARAAIATAVPIFLLGVFMLFSRRKETFRLIGALTIALGLLTVLLPTVLIGTCKPGTAVCNTVERPTMLIIGGIVIAIGVAVLAINERRRDVGGAATDARTPA